jgi:hypothetical protein
MMFNIIIVVILVHKKECIGNVFCRCVDGHKTRKAFMMPYQKQCSLKLFYGKQSRDMDVDAGEPFEEVCIR